jgi:hypothetical protein
MQSDELVLENARLQAEVERLKSLSVESIMIEVIPGRDGMGEEVYAKSVADVQKVFSKFVDASETLQAELTKARELLADFAQWYDEPRLARPAVQIQRDVRVFLSNQSAPAGKGRGEPVACTHGIRAPHACDECEAQTVVPDYWEDPDTGTCIDQWSKIQELNGTEAYTVPLYRHADQPAPVAVVMPAKREMRPFQTVDLGSINYIAGWNACRDEVGRLNPNQQETTSFDQSAALEALARQIYDSWESQPGFHPWVNGGNSLKQGEARHIARQMFELAMANQSKE